MGISPIQLLIVLVIVVLIFGGKRLRSLGSDLGHAIKGFKEVTGDDKEKAQSTQERVTHEQDAGQEIEGGIKQETKTPSDQ